MNTNTMQQQTTHQSTSSKTTSRGLLTQAPVLRPTIFGGHPSDHGIHHGIEHDISSKSFEDKRIERTDHEPLCMLKQRLCDAATGSRKLGALGENYAAQWLEEQGWKILSRNWSCRYGEIDIVMQERDGTLVFVEVKTRRTLRYGTPQEAITRSKQMNLHKSALLWLSEFGRQVKHCGIRFDAFSLWVHEDHVLTHWIPGAF